MEMDVMKGTYKLPSLGKLNKIADSVTLRSMTTGEELLRLDATGTEANRVFCDIIDRCVENPQGFKSYYIPIQDQVFLIYKLRTLTYGSKYPVTLYCPHCGSYVKMNVDLDELPITYMDMEEFSKINEFKLPKCGDTIVQKVVTPSLQDEIDKCILDMKEKVGRTLKPSEVLMEKLSIRIKSVNGEVMVPQMTKQYISSLCAIDFQTLRTHDSYLKTFGLQTTGLSRRCPECGLEFKFALPLTKEFFEPEYL